MGDDAAAIVEAETARQAGMRMVRVQWRNGVKVLHHYVFFILVNQHVQSCMEPYRCEHFTILSIL